MSLQMTILLVAYIQQSVAYSNVAAMPIGCISHVAAKDNCIAANDNHVAAYDDQLHS